MSARRNYGSGIREASRLTGSNWAARLIREGENWIFIEEFELRGKNKKKLVQLLQVDEFKKWITSVLAGKNDKPLVLEGLSDLTEKQLYAFSISEMDFILAGTNSQLAVGDREVWKFVAKINEPVRISTTDEKVDLLQNTVLELQLTQQELQARISAQREAEARLIQAAKLAAVGEMAAGVAHELNNPLTSVVGFTELALDELPEDSSIRSDLELVLREARRARSVVRRLLDFARQSETIRVSADINEIVEDVLMLTHHQLQNNNVLLDVRLGSDLKWAMVDRNQIKQVIINLINNAMYSMPDGGRIEVGTSEQPRYGRSWLTISVRDNGIGIPPENLERIFEPFFTTRADRGGTGLGLSVTYGIVTDHGGMIEVESQQQVGSTFVVWLPLDQTV
jgi:signal transduction histidine kinase